MTYVDPQAQLKADYADLGVSCGYIGNVYCGPVHDDRSFRVFTQVLAKPYPAALREERVTIHVFDVPRSHQGVWMDKVVFDTPEVRAQLDALRAKVASGEARIS
jgi:hypothetical protein